MINVIGTLVSSNVSTFGCGYQTPWNVSVEVITNVWRKYLARSNIPVEVAQTERNNVGILTDDRTTMLIPCVSVSVGSAKGHGTSEAGNNWPRISYVAVGKERRIDLDPVIRNEVFIN